MPLRRLSNGVCLTWAVVFCSVITLPSQGIGSNRYLAFNQGQHDVYCLDRLRKFAYADYYFENKTDEVELDTLRCLHTILQTLRCKWSVNLYTAFWVEGFETAAVDFNVSRKCQVDDHVISWHPKELFTEEQFESLRAPPGVKRRPAEIY